MDCGKSAITSISGAQQREHRLRIRYGHAGELEVNAGDLRSSSNATLAKLAAADGAHVEDNPRQRDGWVDVAEASIMYGVDDEQAVAFKALVRFADTMRRPTLSAREAALVMTTSLSEQRVKKGVQSSAGDKRVESPRQLVDAIIEADDFDVIPGNVFRTHSVNEVATSIVKRLGDTMLTPTTLKPRWSIQALREINFDTDRPGLVQIYVPVEHLSSVVSHGVENLHQRPATQIRRQAFRSQWRAGIEQNLARLKLGDDEAFVEQWRQLRPKSAILEIDWPDNVSYGISGGERYGDAVAVMKPSTYDRITVTPHDSAALGPDKRFATPQRVRTQVRPLEDGRAWVEGTYGEYLEAQIWGTTSPDDIQEFWVPEGAADDVVDAAHAAGHPVFAYRVTRDNDRYRRVRGEQLR